jgi:hypothetical protein
MKLKLTAWVAVLCGVMLSAIVATPARSMSISSGTVACQPIGAPSTDIQHVENGTSTAGLTSGVRLVTCAVPRSPISFSATSGTFTIAGDNRDGRATSTCSLTVYDFTGFFIASSSFTTSAAHWVQNVTLPSSQLPYWGYTSVTCALPEFSRATIEGATAVSPASPSGNINTNATECQTNMWPQDAVLHTDQGIQSAFGTTIPPFVACSVPRSPLAIDATSGGVYVDGDNFNGASTSCILASYDYRGAFVGSKSFTTSSASYDVFLALPAAQLGFWNYTGVHCTLPTNGNGVLRGVTSVQ